MKVLCRSLEEPTVIVSYLASEEHFLSLGRFFLTACDKKNDFFSISLILSNITLSIHFIFCTNKVILSL